MKTIDLTRGERTLAELLALAKHERILIHSATGDDFLLESADAFDREVALLGQSERFMAFLQNRSAEAGGTPLAEVRKKRGQRLPGIWCTRNCNSWGTMAKSE